MITRITLLFPLWALLFALAAYLLPAPFVALKPYIFYLLGVVMFGMGMTLTPANFLEVLRRPGMIALGIGLQFLIMPLAAWVIATAMGLPPLLLAGMVLVGASPGGTASNVMCYLARGDVALSITLTALSTLLAVIATPLLTLAYAGGHIDVDAPRMLLDILKIIVIPVGLGMLVNLLFGHGMKSAKKAFPILSVAAIVIIIAIVVALNRAQLAHIGSPLLGAVMLHNATGLISGYSLAWLFGASARQRKTIAIEVGMQNSGLAVALALKYYPAAAALPGAIFSLWHNVTGAALAAWWARSAR